jgi:hypothetical protein
MIESRSADPPACDTPTHAPAFIHDNDVKASPL